MLRRLGPARHAEARRRAVALLDAQLEALRALGPSGLRLRAGPPRQEEREGIELRTRVDDEGDRLLVLVDARRGRRMLATGGFVMAPDGSTYTPH
jgi:hypothetical protein